MSWVVFFGSVVLNQNRRLSQSHIRARTLARTHTHQPHFQDSRKRVKLIVEKFYARGGWSHFLQSNAEYGYESSSDLHLVHSRSSEPRHGRNGLRARSSSVSK